MGKGFSPLSLGAQYDCRDAGTLRLARIDRVRVWLPTLGSHAPGCDALEHDLSGALAVVSDATLAPAAWVRTILNFPLMFRALVLCSTLYRDGLYYAHSRCRRDHSCEAEARLAQKSRIFSFGALLASW